MTDTVSNHPNTNSSYVVGASSTTAQPAQQSGQNANDYVAHRAQAAPPKSAANYAGIDDATLKEFGYQ